MKKSSINRRSRVVLCIGLLLSVTASRAGQLSIKDSSIFSPKELGIVSLTRDSEGFHVIQNGVKRSVKNHWVDKTLRSIPSDKMEKFLQHGYISVNKMSDGDFTLNAKVRGNGGFLLTGVIVHQSCRAVGYVSLGFTSASTVATGFAVGGIPGAVSAYIGVSAALPGAFATVESVSLTIGTAASFIPFLP
ncbi:MAG: hypothetical protein WC707_01595 [Candidatus Babeliaceae bacterium]|jgi:hypothetical protein